MTPPQPPPVSPATPVPPAQADAAAGGPPPLPTRLVVRSVLTAAGCLAGVILLMLAFEPPGIPDRVEPIGPFELVVHSSGRAGHPSMQWFSLRHKGQRVVVTGKAGMYGDGTAAYDTFNSAITFAAPEPAVIVNVGDPINSGFFYLVREKDGQPVTEYIGHSSGGVTAEIVDTLPRRRAAPADRDLTTKRARLGSGRWLLLGDYCVFDTSELKGYSFDQAKDASLNQSASPLALSPDQRSLVRFGYGNYPGNEPLLIVYDFVGNVSYTLPIDKTGMRFVRWEDLDREWVEHYFEWKADGTDRQRLVRRAGVAPLPYHGTLKTDGSGYREYRLSPVSPEMVRVLADFLAREFGATRVEGGVADAERAELKIGGATVHVSASDRDVTVWMNRDAGRTKVVVDIATRFDRELATGRYDALFNPPEPEASGEAGGEPPTEPAAAGHAHPQ